MSAIIVGMYKDAVEDKFLSEEPFLVLRRDGRGSSGQGGTPHWRDVLYCQVMAKQGIPYREIRRRLKVACEIDLDQKTIGRYVRDYHLVENKEPDVPPWDPMLDGKFTSWLNYVGVYDRAAAGLPRVRTYWQQATPSQETLEDIDREWSEHWKQIPIVLLPREVGDEEL